MKKSFLIYTFTTISLFVALQIPFSNLLGAKVIFSLFDFIAPSMGGILGLPFAIGVILTAQIINLFVHQPIAIAMIVRIIPSLFAVWYFSKSHKTSLIIPIICIAIFNLNPVGRSAFVFSLLWLIPLVSYFFRRNVFIRSVGAVFTAHAVGGAMWVWMFGLTKETWLALIPQVLIERVLMAAGVSFVFVSVQALIHRLSMVKKIPHTGRIFN